MRIIKTTIAVLLLGMFATSAYADVILAVDADAGTAGIQNSLTVNVGDTFSLFTVVMPDDTHIADPFDTIVYELFSSMNIVTLVDVVVADFPAETSFFGITTDIFGEAVVTAGDPLTQGGEFDSLIGLSSLAGPFGGPLGLAGLGDVQIVLYTFEATGIGQTTMTMVPDLTVSGGMLANAGLPVDSETRPALITVEGAGPVTTNTIADPNPVAINSNVDLTANVDDTNTGGSNIRSAEYSVDGGTTWSPMGATDSTFDEVSEDVQVSFNAPTAAGIRDLCVRGTDDRGNLGDPECIMLVVYDPSGLFVTGGGWIDSPAGAYIANDTLTGKANFGFISKYKKGANVPTGNTEFQFQTADLNFHSSSYEFLVITMGGTNAQFKGSGTINGTPAPNGMDFKFMLWANDGNPDTFRIRIWYEDNGVEMDVYDNGFDQAIGGGSIVIHTKGKK